MTRRQLLSACAAAPVVAALPGVPSTAPRFTETIRSISNCVHVVGIDYETGTIYLEDGSVHRTHHTDLPMFHLGMPVYVGLRA